MITFKKWFLAEIGGFWSEPDKEQIPAGAVPRVNKDEDPPKPKKKSPIAKYVVPIQYAKETYSNIE